MKIDLHNKTHWRNDHIRAFLVPMIREERPDLCKRGAPTLKVIVVYTRGGNGSSGCAYVKSNWMKIRLPKNVEPDKVDFAHVIAHELAHTRGMTHAHGMYRIPRYGRVGRWREIYAWADALPLEIAPKPYRKSATPDVKLRHAETMLMAAMTREKRAKTIRTKWQNKVKYYAKRAALTQAALSITEQ